MAEATDRPNLRFRFSSNRAGAEAPRALKRCDLHDLGEGMHARVSPAFLAPIGKPPRGPFPGRATIGRRPATTLHRHSRQDCAQDTLSNVPIISVPLHFLGRDDALATSTRRSRKEMVGCYHGTTRSAWRPARPLLAAAYAERHHGDYRADMVDQGAERPSMPAPISSLSAFARLGRRRR